MAEYIDRAEYCEKYCRCNNDYCNRQSCPIWKAPAADVAPVVHGRWIMHDDELGLTCECSVCHIETMGDGNYCPNCGAKMDGGDTDAAD